jgi:hypothetical protein
MSVEHSICHVVVCDACRGLLDDGTDGFIPHFDTADTALDAALQQGWSVDTDGRTYCHPCVALARCLTDGHTYGPWIPCHCQGRIPGHDTTGCGLFRSCQHCGQHDDTDLAHLPTTPEPHVPGR